MYICTSLTIAGCARLQPVSLEARSALAEHVTRRAKRVARHQPLHPRRPTTVRAWARTTAAKARLDASALERLVAQSKRSGASRLVVVHDGALVGRWAFDGAEGPLELQGITRALVSLSAGRALGAQGMRALDEPLWKTFPAWRHGEKAQVTPHHLLRQTAGLEDARHALLTAPNQTRMAHTLDLEALPGARFRDNPSGAPLVCAWLSARAGVRIDRLVAERVLRKIGVWRVRWRLDPAGQPMCMVGVAMRALDVARVGQLALNEGGWRGRAVVPARWVRRALRPGQTLYPRAALMGWWRWSEWSEVVITPKHMARMKAAGVSQRVRAALRPLVGKKMREEDFERALTGALGPKWLLDARAEIWSRGLSLAARRYGPARGMYAVGAGGQLLLIWPQAKLVIVRMQAADPSRARRTRLDVPNFLRLVRALPAAP